MSSATGQAERESAGGAAAAKSRQERLLDRARGLAPDLLWLLTGPLLCQIGTARHELCHALGAVVVGVPVTRIVFWPFSEPGLGLGAGYVLTGPTRNPLVYLAPYLFSLITFPLCCWLYTSRTWRWAWARLSFAFLGIYYPIIEFVVAFVYGLVRHEGDAGVLRTMMPPLAMYVFCAVSCIVYVAGVVGVTVLGRPVEA